MLVNSSNVSFPQNTWLQHVMHKTLNGSTEVSLQNMSATGQRHTLLCIYITQTYFIACSTAVCANFEWCNLSDPLQNSCLKHDIDVVIPEVSKKPFSEWQLRMSRNVAFLEFLVQFCTLRKITRLYLAYSSYSLRKALGALKWLWEVSNWHSGKDVLPYKKGGKEKALKITMEGEKQLGDVWG